MAREAKVSIATVSRTMNHVPTVGRKLAARVRDAARRLNYLPNSQARALGSGRSRLLGLIVSEITNPFFPELIQGFEEVAVEHGYEILVNFTNGDPARMRQCARRMMERRAEGVAVLTFGSDQSVLEEPRARGVPLVFVGDGPARPDASFLQIDYHHGIRQGVEHLVALGHRDIGFVTGPARLSSAQARVEAFRAAMRECGMALHKNWLFESDHTLEGGMAAARLMLAKRRRPSALMCSNDLLAIGVLHEFARRGIRVPSDFSVIGYDDIRLTRMMAPPLTSILMSRTELARAAVTALRTRIEDGAPERVYIIKTRLVVRESTGPAGIAVPEPASSQGRQAGDERQPVAALASPVLP